MPGVMENQSLSFQRPLKEEIRERRDPFAALLYVDPRQRPSRMICVIADGDVHGAGG